MELLEKSFENTWSAGLLESLGAKFIIDARLVGGWIIYIEIGKYAGVPVEERVEASIYNYFDIALPVEIFRSYVLGSINTSVPVYNTY